MQVRDPEALRRWRQRRGLSQRDLAYLCRCTQAAISLLERGGMSSLSDELALSLSARLQVPWEELFTVASPTPGTPSSAGQAGGAVPSPSLPERSGA
jgi:transcriptional regulator with XRE-family HTH domain